MECPTLSMLSINEYAILPCFLILYLVTYMLPLYGEIKIFKNDRPENVAVGSKFPFSVEKLIILIKLYMSLLLPSKQ